MKLKNILVITYWSYKDALIQTYTLPYVRIIRKIIPEGSKIYLVTYESEVYPLSPSEKEQIRKELLQEGIVWIDFRYRNFGLAAFLIGIYSIIRLWFTCLIHSITYIHCWCTPAGTLGLILSKLTGKKLIIDSYEPHAEAMVENKTWNKNSFAYRLLFFFEKRQSKHAKAVIAATKGMNLYAKEKYRVELKHFYVKPACVDFNVFSLNTTYPELRKELGLENKIVCVYSGKFGGIYLEKEVFNFLKIASDYWKDNFRVLLLTNSTREEINRFASQANLNIDIVLNRFVSHHEVPIYLSLASFAINPVKPVPTKRYCTSIKDGEYWAMGLPVVITSNISDDSEIIAENNIGAVLLYLNNYEYLQAVKKIESLINPLNQKQLCQKIIDVAHMFRSYEIAESVYKEIYYRD